MSFGNRIPLPTTSKAGLHHRSQRPPLCQTQGQKQPMVRLWGGNFGEVNIAAHEIRIFNGRGQKRYRCCCCLAIVMFGRAYLDWTKKKCHWSWDNNWTAILLTGLNVFIEPLIGPLGFADLPQRIPQQEHFQKFWNINAFILYHICPYNVYNYWNYSI